jgi:hypothetical protein
MRFRLANTGNPLADGVSNGMASLFSMPYARAAAEEEAQYAGAKQRLVESQIADHVAQAALRKQEADRAAQIPDVLDTVMAAQANTDVPTLNRYRQSLRTGVQPMTSASGDADTDAAIGIPTQPALDPKVAQALGLQMQRMAPAMVNPKSYTVQGQADATGKYQDQDVLSQAVAAAQRGDDMGMSRLNAVRGKKEFTPYRSVGNTGVALNEVTGAGTVADAGLRALFGDKVGSEIGENKAQANSANAAAGAHSASGRLSDARRERVMGGYDKPVTILDDDTGEAAITRIPTGADPVTVGVAPKKKTGTDATNAKERNRVVRDVEKDLVGAGDAEIQAEVDRRMARRGGAAAPPAGPKPAGAPAKIEAAPLDAKQRKAGAVYQTPKGAMKWTGTGWLPAN